MRDISLHLMDIIRNSIDAQAEKVAIRLKADLSLNLLTVEVEDNGHGMDQELLCRVTDPFVTTRTTRKVGLGIPLLKASARLTGGDISIKSVKGSGTVITADFNITHIDRLPLGDIGSTVSTLVMAHPDIEFRLDLDNTNESFSFNSFVIRDVLGDVPLNSFEVVDWIRAYVNDGITKIFGGVLHEVDS